jgi:hypothetical protein
MQRVSFEKKGQRAGQQRIALELSDIGGRRSSLG